MEKEKRILIVEPDPHMSEKLYQIFRRERIVVSLTERVSEAIRKIQEEQDRKARGVLSGLRELQFSMTLDQLNPVASKEIINQVKALKKNPDADELRKMITHLAEEIESKLETMANADPAIKPLEDSVRTLSILMDLYFSM